MVRVFRPIFREVVFAGALDPNTPSPRAATRVAPQASIPVLGGEPYRPLSTPMTRSKP